MHLFGKPEEDEDNKKKQALTNTLGIDLGTLNTVVAKPSGDKFDLFKIPSVVAVKKEEPSYVLAVGEDAKAMLGRTPEDIDRKSTRLNSSHTQTSRMPSSA